MGGWWWDGGTHHWWDCRLSKRTVGIARGRDWPWESWDGLLSFADSSHNPGISKKPGRHLSTVLVKFVIIALSVINYIVSTKKDHFLRLSDLKYYLVGPTHSPPSFKSLDDKSKSVTIHDDDCRHERQRQHGWKFYGAFPGHLGPNPSPLFS